MPDETDDRAGAADIHSRLECLAAELEAELGPAIQVGRQNKDFGTIWDVTPSNPRALGVGWIAFVGPELQLYTASGLGGEWELSRTQSDVDFIEEMVRAVVAGRVTETFAPRRSRVTITRLDGSREIETGYSGLEGCFPLPFWPRWARTEQYEPYA